jgi:putative SOS response-associated peptidase YedK
MCGRYSLVTERRDLARELRIPLDVVLADLEPRYNIAPSQPVPILLRDGALRMARARWGLVPPWAGDPRAGNRMINARRESLASKPSFRDSFRYRRCLVIADGFYEWLKRENPPAKIPHYIRLRSGSPFTFAGLWSVWTSPAREEVLSCTIVTSPPNDLVARIHDRMPVILPPGSRERWIDPEGADERELLELLQPHDADEMEMYAVSRWVNAPENEGARCIAPDASQDPQIELEFRPVPPRPATRRRGSR